MTITEEMIEAIAKTICRAHFARKLWHGACSKEARLDFLARKHWRDWKPDADSVAALFPLIARQVREATIEECAKVAEAKAVEFLSPQYATNQPLCSISERFACHQTAAAIRALAGKETGNG